MGPKFFRIQHRAIRIFRASIEKVQTNLSCKPSSNPNPTKAKLRIDLQGTVIMVALMIGWEDQTITACVWGLIKIKNPNKNVTGSSVEERAVVLTVLSTALLTALPEL